MSATMTVPAALLLATATTMVTPQENDVLCSKDKTHSSHKGNRIFRERIDSMKEIYRKTKNKQGKMEITKDIVKYLKDNHAARFLKRSGTGVWAEISDQAARDKVSHALRFATRRDKKNELSKSQEAMTEIRQKLPTEPTGVTPDPNNNSGSANQSTPDLIVPTDAPAPKPVYCGVIPEEHIEPSKWLLALRQGS